MSENCSRRIAHLSGPTHVRRHLQCQIGTKLDGPFGRPYSLATPQHHQEDTKKQLYSYFHGRCQNNRPTFDGKHQNCKIYNLMGNIKIIKELPFSS
ncbi:unnamed protein product [Ixodes pacificus]